MEQLNIGDYVLATKYDDGDSQDHWVVGFYGGITAPHYNPPRYDVLDANGKNYRGNGFRKVVKITTEQGKWIVEHMKEISQSDISVWDWYKNELPK